MFRLPIAAAAAIMTAACGMNPGGVSWDDPAGNVRPPTNRPDAPLLDIVRVEARGAEGALRVKVRLKDDLQRFFGYTRPDGKKAGEVVAHFFIDADNNAETGGHPRWATEAKRPLRGYEFDVSLQLGYRYRKEGASGSVSGNALVDTAKVTDLQPIAVFGVARLRQGSDGYDFQNFKLPEGSRETAQKATTWKQDTIEFAIPYDWLGVKPGQTVRLCFKDQAIGTASGSGISEDRLLRLD